MHNLHDCFSFCCPYYYYYYCYYVLILCGRVGYIDAHCSEPKAISSILLISIKRLSDFAFHPCLLILDIGTHTPENYLH